MDKYLVTGATGLVGYHIVKSLLMRHKAVKVLVRERERARFLAELGCEIAVGDVTDGDSIASAMAGCDHVYHAAGIPEQWLKSKQRFQEVNVQGTANMIGHAVALKVKRFVYTSTIDVFKAESGQYFDEAVIDDKPKHTAYERSKQEADDLVVAALKNRQLPAIFLHPAAVYGPGPTRSLGVNDFVERLLAQKIPLLLPGGMPVVFASDVGEGHVLAGEQAAIGERFILSESYQEVREIAQTVLNLASIKTLPKVAPLSLVKIIASLGEAWASLSGKPPMVARGQVSFLQWQARPQSDKAQQQLHWQPTSFVDGLKALMATLATPSMTTLQEPQ